MARNPLKSRNPNAVAEVRRPARNVVAETVRSVSSVVVEIARLAHNAAVATGRYAPRAAAEIGKHGRPAQIVAVTATVPSRCASHRPKIAAVAEVAIRPASPVAAMIVRTRSGLNLAIIAGVDRTM